MKTGAIPVRQSEQKLGHSLNNNKPDTALIVAYNEPTELLETTLISEGFSHTVLRQKPAPDYQNFSRSYRCLLNHYRAWRIIARSPKPTLVVEADFVPVIGFSQLPLPYDSQQEDLGIAWLYTCAPQVYSVSPEGYAEGFSTSGVAYILSPQGAKYLLEFAAAIAEKIGPTEYSTWDSEIDSFLRAKNLINYIPFRNYGEHGGIPNPEHYQNGLSQTHRADVLYGKLAFMPFYATGSSFPTLTLFWVRLKARIKGLGRLLLGRFVRPFMVKKSPAPIRLLSFAIRRQLSVRL